MMLMAAVVMFSGCGKDDDDDSQLILGRWQFKSSTYTRFVNGAQVGQPDVDTDDDYFIEFFDNGKANWDGEPATYKIDGKTLTIFESEDPDDKDVVQISKLNKNELEVTAEETYTENGQTVRSVYVEAFTK